MANFQNRLSTYSTLSASTPRPGPGGSAQVSTSTLLNALHTAYASRQPYQLESSTSLVVNTWRTASEVDPEGRIGGTVDLEIGRRAWEHARRRAEDGCILLGSLHESTPSLLAPFVSGMPLSLPTSFYHALDVLKAFTHCVTPQNPSYPRHSSLAATFNLNLTGVVRGVSIALSTSGIDTTQGLLEIPSEVGFRAFNVFYYLHSSSASKAERETLGLKHVSQYALLNKSGTFNPPSYLPTADDEAAAEDFRANLRAIGIRGRDMSYLLAALTGILKLGDTMTYDVDGDVLQEVCEDVGGLLDVNPQSLVSKFDQLDRPVLIAGIYEALVDWVITRANNTMRQELIAMKAGQSPEGSDIDVITPGSSEDDGDSVSITVIEVPSQSLGRAIALQTVFDDTEGINREMKDDGVPVVSAGSSVLAEMKAAIAEREPELGITNGPAGREKEQEKERREAVLEKFAYEVEPDGFLRDVLFPTSGHGIQLGTVGRFDLMNAISSSRVWYQLAIHPTDDGPASIASGNNTWSAGTVSRQLRAWRLPEWANRRNKHLDFTADFDVDEFAQRYSRLGCMDGKDGVESWILERGWSNGEVVIGRERIWMREDTWWGAETMLDLKPFDDTPQTMMGMGGGVAGLESGYSTQSPGLGSGFFAPQPEGSSFQDSRDNLLKRQHSSATLGTRSAFGAQSLAPTAQRNTRTVSVGDYGLGPKGDDHKGDVTYEGGFDPETGVNQVVTEQPISTIRRLWVGFVWALTFWIPSPLLRYIGRMKRPDVRMAWREKFVLVFLIFILNAIVVFLIVGFGRVLCPNWDKAWSRTEVSHHQGETDFWVSHHGKVYDVSKYWKKQHSDVTGLDTTSDVMMPLAGFDLDPYVPPPITLACPHLNVASSVTLYFNNTRLEYQTAQHLSGVNAVYSNSDLAITNWYTANFLKTMKEYYKGDLVVDKKDIASEAENNSRMWVIMYGKVFDFSDYFITLDRFDSNPLYSFLDSKVESMVKDHAGSDITELFENQLNATAYQNNWQCIQNMFYVGIIDFRKTARCQAVNYILLAFTIILAAVILVKFLAALQLGSKRRPASQDKFVICQVPAYTEGEDQLRKGLDSLTALAYDNKRKLICVICDGMIVGGGNDRPTPKIVLDILGVDPKVDPPALPFKSVGQGSEQLNYGKVYSGLYEYEGNVVPYIVVVKVGKESEQVKSKPGNRGKRDSQILLMSFLNRVHHRAPMSPLELEMFHQINNVIGVDPELYEYLLMVDADTMVKEDALTRLVASCANDAKIAGICGETSLENEERSWWTMIQVYEYYISHHLAKAFESLFGSVTCLPGCFCMYRLRTADKGRPLIISDKVIADYSDCDVDTLHKKNLLSLGEDRYLTTLMTKHFPSMSYKFVPDAFAQTAAPETWSILLSQRRRWINSTIHNLAELVFLKDMCGFCCFSMRFVVFIDLFGTIILPATCGYLGYLIYTLATHTGQIPVISLAILAGVYGLQAIIFIIKRQWQHIGWMIIYILAFPIYSFILPVYSFWKQDDFSWGNTRVVIGEKGNKQVVAVNDEGFDPRSIPLQRWDDYASANNLPGRRGVGNEKQHSAYDDDGYEMNDMQSVYSSVKPASTILTGFPGQAPPHMPPASPGPYNALQHRASHYSNFSRYTDHPLDGRNTSMNNLTEASPYGRASMAGFQSSDNLMTQMNSPQQRGKSPLGFASRPTSTVNFQNMMNGPTDMMIVEAIQACLREVDMDTVTKKQLKALTEQRLQTQLSGERKAFLDQAIDQELANM